MPTALVIVSPIFTRFSLSTTHDSCPNTTLLDVFFGLGEAKKAAGPEKRPNELPVLSNSAEILARGTKSESITIHQIGG